MSEDFFIFELLETLN